MSCFRWVRDIRGEGKSSTISLLPLCSTCRTPNMFANELVDVREAVGDIDLLGMAKSAEELVLDAYKGP